jgi:Pup amidohydrolase
VCLLRSIIFLINEIGLKNERFISMESKNKRIPKLVGTETEYGIMIVGGKQSDPFLASRRLLQAYALLKRTVVPYAASFSQRTQASTTQLPILTINPDKGRAVFPAEELDFMLDNGARLYIDHAHPEYSTPECLSPRQLVAADKAGEQLLSDCQQIVNDSHMLPQEQHILIYKNNSDYKNHSYGCHENYLLSHEFFTDLVYRRMHRLFRTFLPFFITRIIFCGAGKIGGENGTLPAGFQLSQRADFFEELIGLQTTQQRPLFNVRDEPHADPTRYRRLHIILGDANMAECSTYLKVGTAQLVLQMLEENFLSIDLTLRDPLAAIQIISRDLSFQKPLPLEEGTQITALEIQQVYLEQAQQYLKQKGGSAEEWEVWHSWDEALAALPGHPEKLSVRLDWAIKLRILNHYLESHNSDWKQVAAWQPVIEAHEKPEAARAIARAAGLAWKDYDNQQALYFGLRRLDLEYHDIRQGASPEESGLFYRLQQHGIIERIITDEEITQMKNDPPENTRAWLRGQCIRRFGQELITADWESLSFSGPPDQEKQRLCLRLDNPLASTAETWKLAWPQLKDSDRFLEYYSTRPDALLGEEKYG